MSLLSKIEWTDATWNPVRGCTKISPGCKHCYAETFAERFRGVRAILTSKVSIYGWYRQTGGAAAVGESKMIFVNSMSDLFHDEVPD